MTTPSSGIPIMNCSTPTSASSSASTLLPTPRSIRHGRSISASVGCKDKGVSSSISTPTQSTTTANTTGSPKVTPPATPHSWGSVTMRRNSFLSKNMLGNEEHRYYRMGRALDGSEEYRLSVSSSQGFLWNQDLFASKYHQKLSVSTNSPGANESYGSMAPIEVHEIHPDDMSDYAIDDSDNDGDIFPKLEM